MKALITLIAAAAIAAALALAPGAAEASVKRLATQECRSDRAESPGEFAARWGGTGRKAVKRCARHETREARRDCREDRRESPSRFESRFGGSGKRAIKRCMRHEIR
jgi:hypothetical protein